MRQIGVEGADLETCVSRAQQERLLLTRKGRPVALVVGVQGMSVEQLELGTSEKFWKLIAQRRRQRTITRAALEQRARRADPGGFDRILSRVPDVPPLPDDEREPAKTRRGPNRRMQPARQKRARG